MMSAFPIPSEALALHWLNAYIEPEYILPEGSSVAKSLDTTRYTFCGALCAEILGKENPHTYTATDVVELCLREFGAIADGRNPIPKPRGDLVDEAGFLRSDLLV